MKLLSDFRDYYDHWFETTSEPTFNRLMVQGPTKQEQFELINQAGYNVIPYGRPIDFSDEDLLVVLHAGEGKILLSQPEALARHPEKLCSLFIKSPKYYTNNANSTRYLWVGSRCFEFFYENLDAKEWRSNVGEVDVTFLSELTNHPHPKCLAQFPLVAIDFVGGQDEFTNYAIDLNISPGLKHTGIEDVLKAKEVYDLIVSWVKNGR
jgi:hypothetical protein